MYIPYKLKSLIFSIVDFFDSKRTLYFLQKYVTKRSQIKKLNIDDNWIRHQKALTDYGCTGFVFEFGAGKNIAQNIFLSQFIDKQLVVDLNPMLDIQLVNVVLDLLSKKFKLKSDVKIIKLEDLNNYGIDYRAPYDASVTNLNPKILDACISTNTLEHIPVASIKSIFMELKRILKDSGIVSAKIDYSDHYAHTDSKLTLLNFLNFSEFEWKKYNHQCHYQNRLRHYQYKQLFNECGFYIIKEELIFDEKNISQDLHFKFKDKDQSWSATSAHLVLKKIITNS
jgi:hypothetical protein